ncbi:MAG TPA: FG-GAP-like repeat-containing protein, partial [Tepidisphaeraceae bacterium]|nr:FG-GAP-like repeat-containing protein [Tepidisphaeraceae bacterium]
MLFFRARKKQPPAPPRRPAPRFIEALEQRLLLSSSAPTLLSIDRAIPAAPATNAVTVTYAVTFSEPVTGVTAADFQVAAGTGVSTALTPIISPTSGYNAVYAVTVSGIAGNGSLGLNLVNTAGIVDASGTPMATQSNSAIFQAAIDYAAGLNPFSVTVGDFNGDGEADLVVANFNSGGVSVLLGNGNGTFQAAVSYDTGSNPRSVAVGDFNGDGKADLAVANSNSNNVSVLLGDGNGTFQPAVNYAIIGAVSVAVGDFNGDGNVDLAVEDDAGVSVLLGNGNGTFQAAMNYAAGDIGNSITVGDFNGDGKADLAIAGDGVSVLLGKGNGVFQPAVNYDAGSVYYSVAVGDFNRDGEADLVASGRDGIVLLGNGNGTFRAAANYALGNNQGSVVVSDFNGDGKTDLAVANTNSNNASVLLGNGDGTFQPAVNYGVGSFPYSVAAGDFNGDGKADLALANFESNNVSVLLGNGNGKFQAAVDYAVGTQPQSVTVGDFNGDGKTDLAVANFESNNVSVLLGNGNGAFQAAVNYAAGTQPQSVTVGDFNGDGKPDLAVADVGGGVSVLRGNGNGTFQTAVNYATGSYPYSVTVGDFNADGRADLAVANDNSGNVSVLLGNGDGTFQAAVNYAAGSGPASIAVGDFNGDGKIDLAVANANSDNVSVLLGNGDGTFQAASNYAAGISPVSVTVGDFNGDGKPDLAVALADYYSNNVSVLLGNGNGTFQPTVNYTAGTRPQSVTVGDFNGDGKPDLAVADSFSFGSGVDVLLGNGNGTFQAAVNFFAGNAPYSVAVGDFNGDGKTDLVVALAGGDVSVLLNESVSAIVGQTYIVGPVEQPRPLNFGAPEDGVIAAPFGTDAWPFSAGSGTQLELRVIGASEPTISFTLTGPSGYTAFQNITSNSPLINLPSSGDYTLSVHANGVGGAYSFEVDQTTVTPLALGAAYNGTWAGSGQAQLFTLPVTTADPMSIILSDPATADHTELYASFGAPPTRQTYDYGVNGSGSSQSLLVPEANAGTWYVLVYGASIPSAPDGFSLVAKTADVFLSAATPAHSGTIVNTVFTLNGAGFNAYTAVQLVGGDGSVFSPAQLTIASTSQINATFTAGSVPAGTYTIRVTSSSGTTASLANAFTMINGGQAILTTKVIAPSVIGYHLPSTIYVEYANTGTAPMPAPLLTLTGLMNNLQGAFLTLDQSLANESFWQTAIPAGYATSVSFIASGATPGILQPGESVTVPVHYAGWIYSQWDFSRPPIYFNVGTLKADSTQPIDWTAFANQTQPAGVSATTWATVVNQLAPQIGPTWGDYVAALDGVATRLALRGQPTVDASALLAFEVTQAEGLPVGEISAWVLDATTGQPLAGVTVNDLSTDDRSSATGTTDANGYFTFTGLYDGAHNLSLSGYFIGSNAPVTITTTTDALGLQLLATKAGQITGKVTAASSGQPLPNILVLCTGQTTGQSFEVLTAADGSYSFDTLPADTYAVSVSANGYVSNSINGVVIALGQTVSNEGFALAAGATISGTVSSQAGASPLAGATILAQSQTTNFTSATATAADGTFSLADLAADTYAIECTLPGYLTQTITGVQVVADGNMSGRDFSLVAAASIQGTLANASDESPVANASLTVTDGAGNTFYANTDATGAFAFNDLPQGTYSVAYNPTNALPLQQTFTVIAGQTLTGVSLQVQVGGAIAGTVIIANSGAPLEDVPVFAITPAGAELDTRSDVNGHYSFANLDAGTYQVNVVGAPARNAQAVKVVQLDGTLVSANIAISYSTTISGTLLDAAGSPIQGSVSLYEGGELVTTAQSDSSGTYGFLLSQGGQFELQGVASSATFAPISLTINSGDNAVQNIAAGSSTLTLNMSSPGASPTGTPVNLFEYTGNGLIYCESTNLDSNGDATFGAMAQGSYRVTIDTADGYGAMQTVAVATPTAAANIALSQLISVSGIISGPAGTSLSGAMVYLTDAANTVLSAAQTQADGSYTLTPVPSGAYTIIVIADGYQALVQPNFTVTNGAAFNASLAASSATIIGRLVDGTGAPIQNVSIAVLDAAGDPIGDAVTGADGTFAITTSVGANITILASLRGYNSAKVPLSNGAAGTVNVGDITILFTATAGAKPIATTGGNAANHLAGALESVRSSAIAIPNDVPAPSNEDIFLLQAKHDTLQVDLTLYTAAGHSKASAPVYDQSVDGNVAINAANKLLYDNWTAAKNKVGANLLPVGSDVYKLEDDLLGLQGYIDAAKSAQTNMSSEQGKMWSAAGAVGNSMFALLLVASGVEELAIGWEILTALWSVLSKGFNGESTAEVFRTLATTIEIELAPLLHSASIGVQASALSSAAGRWLSEYDGLDASLSLGREKAAAASNDDAILQTDYKAMVELENELYLPPAAVPPGPAPVIPTTPGGGATTEVPTSQDPNNKIGAAGFGPQGFVGAGNPLPYRIDFENSPTASAPAQQVTVTDNLDPNLNWSTFQLTGVGFGNDNFTISGGSQHYQTTASMTYNGQTFDVDIETGINMITGQVYATFQSIDPNTGLPPSSVLTGFLPPEDGTGRGTGYFSYFVSPKASLLTGTQIRNIADISFDQQPIITTDQVNDEDPSKGVDPAKQDLITIDAVAPASRVAALPANASSATFAVTWAGQDDVGGSGIASYTIYASADGGPFAPWLVNTALTTAAFAGVSGHSYAFYSAATDNVGNVEAAHAAADATTAVPFGTVSGNVFVDANSNGKRDAGEYGLGGVGVFLDLNGNG